MDIEKIAKLISEDPDLLEGMEILGSEGETPIIIPWVKVPKWFNGWLEILPAEHAKQVLMAFVTADKTKQKAYLDLARRHLEPHASL